MVSLPRCAKSIIDYFACGYNTSSVSESINSILKRKLPKRPITLVELRKLITFSKNKI